MITNIINIGNSQGVRLPKVLLHECGFDKVKSVEVVVKNHQLIIKKAKHPRAGWRESFQRMARAGDDKLLDESFANDFDKDEWEWR
jgi:antitoxin MazE